MNLHPAKAKPAASRPAPDLSTPAAAYTVYQKALQSEDAAAMRKLLYISDPQKARVVNSMVDFAVASHHLERAAVKRFGEPGKMVLGTPRTVDEQIAIDLDRLIDANISIDKVQQTAEIILLPETNPPEGTAPDESTFLKQVSKAWKIDAVKTFRFDDPDKADQLKLTSKANARMAPALHELAKQIEQNKLNTPQDAKAALTKAWDTAMGNSANDEPAPMPDDSPSKPDKPAPAEDGPRQ